MENNYIAVCGLLACLSSSYKMSEEDLGNIESALRDLCNIFPDRFEYCRVNDGFDLRVKTPDASKIEEWIRGTDGAGKKLSKDEAVERLMDEVDVLLDFIPEGFSVPLGYSVVVGQVRNAMEKVRGFMSKREQ